VTLPKLSFMRVATTIVGQMEEGAPEAPAVETA
jgi:hypothetical protein